MRWFHYSVLPHLITMRAMPKAYYPRVSFHWCARLMAWVDLPAARAFSSHDFDIEYQFISSRTSRWFSIFLATLEYTYSPTALPAISINEVSLFTTELRNAKIYKYDDYFITRIRLRDYFRHHTLDFSCTVLTYVISAASEHSRFRRDGYWCALATVDISLFMSPTPTKMPHLSIILILAVDFGMSPHRFRLPVLAIQFTTSTTRYVFFLQVARFLV